MPAWTSLLRLRAPRAILAAALAMSGVSGCASMNGSQTAMTTPSLIATATAQPTVGAPMSGVAGWNGDISSPGLTGTHRTLPIGSVVRVTNLQSGQSAVVQVVGPMVSTPERDMDLSRDAAAAVGALQSGVATVLIEPTQAQTPVAAVAPSYAPSAYSSAAYPPAAPGVAMTPPAAQPQTFAAPLAQLTSPIGGGVEYDPNLSTASIPLETALGDDSESPARAGMAGARFLQFGSYTNQANAEAQLDKLRQNGLAGGAYGQAAIEQAHVGGVLRHRVRLGPIASADLAAQALSEARRLGHDDVRIMTP